MSDASPPWHQRVRWTLGLVLALSLLVFLLQLTRVRPMLWPAGAGLTVAGDIALGSLAMPPTMPRIRPPGVDSVAGLPITITAVAPDSEAARAGLLPSTLVNAIRGTRGQVDVPGGLPRDPAAILRVWRQAYRLGPSSPLTLEIGQAGATRVVALSRQPVWQTGGETPAAWLRLHAGALVQMAAFLAGAIALVALGTRGTTATLMTLALVATGIANGGPMLGAELDVPLIGELLLLFGWLVTPLAFPVIGLAVLYFPTRADVLDRHRWITPAIAAASAPMLVISLLSAAFLLGADGVLPALAWIAAHGWTFDASFAIALAANVLIVIEGIARYRQNPDPNERRRIHIVVFTGVPAVFAYALKTGVPLLASLLGRPLELHWLVETALQAIVLLPAFGLPYAVAVRHVFSPRTVLRQSLQYALARRTLSVLLVLPVAALVVSLIRERDRPLGDIVLGQPIFYILCLGFAALGLRYRDPAQQWLDRRFFRAEYDAREILVSLASRVPYETDPRELVAMVLTQIDSALHPSAVAVLAGEGDSLEVISSLRHDVEPLARGSGLATLLRWSEEPLEVFLDEDRSPVARLPAPDRQWLARSRASLLVPMFTGSGEGRLLIGMIVLGQKRSEEPYTAEDRRTLSGIAAQMSVALDLSRMRRRASESLVATPIVTPVGTPTMIMGTAPASAPSLTMCPSCRRCFDMATLTRGPHPEPRCPDDGEPLQPVLGMTPVVDGKYRVDAMIGRGGMGAVFRARDLRLDRDVAIKIVRADLVADPDSRARFQREAQVVARLQHPAIVIVFDYGNLQDGAAFLVMEFVRGEDFRHLLKREGTLDRARTVELMSAVSMGVDAAHRAGVLHRDLKPENVLLPANGTGPKVLDFGLAKITDAEGGMATQAMLTHGATIIGTPAYMAPEQLRGEPVDGRADVFSLGVMTYEALSGKTPFGGGSFVEVGIQQSRGIASLDTSRLPASVSATVLRALSIDRERRPGTPAAFVEELRTKN